MAVRQLSLADYASAVGQLGASWRKIKDDEAAAKGERQGAGATIGGIAGGIAGSFFGPAGTAIGAAGGSALGGALSAGDKNSVGGGGNGTTASQYAQGFSLGNTAGSSIAAANKESLISKGLSALAASRASARNPEAKPSAVVNEPIMSQPARPGTSYAGVEGATEEGTTPLGEQAPSVQTGTRERLAFTPGEMAQNAKRKGLLDTISELGKAGAFTAANAPGLSELISPSFKPVDVTGGSAYGTFDPSTGDYNLSGIVPKQFKNAEEQFGTGTMGMMARVANIDTRAANGDPVTQEERFFAAQAKQWLSATAAGVGPDGNPVMAPRVQYGPNSPYQQAAPKPGLSGLIPGGRSEAPKLNPVNRQDTQTGAAALTGSQHLGTIMKNSHVFGDVPYGNIGTVISGKLGQDVDMIEVNNSILGLAAAAEAIMPGPETEKDSARVRELIGDPTSPWAKIEVAVKSQSQKINNHLLGTMRNSVAANTRIDESSREAILNSSQFVPIQLRDKNDPLIPYLLPGTKTTFAKKGK